MYRMPDEKWAELDAETRHRINLEEKVVTAIVDAALKAGYLVTVDDGGDDGEYAIEDSADRKAILDALMNTDEDVIILAPKPGVALRSGSISLVYGNSGWDVISDYHTRLEAFIAPIQRIAEGLDRQVA